MVNYDNGVIYKIVYNNIIHYIGSSTNFKRRKQSHKNCCNDINDNHHNTPLYIFMRNNNWSNRWCGTWTIEIVEYYPCKTKIELETRERFFIDEYNPILNVNKPLQTHKEWELVNKEKLKLQRATFHKNNSERLNANSNAYYQENRAVMNATGRINYANNREERKIKMAKYRSDNKEKIKLQKATAYKLKKEKRNLTI